MPRTCYDYIIVGAGSSGCVLANRLSADPAVTVLLVEAGPDDTSPLIAMPRGIGKLLAPGNPHVWSYPVSPRGNALSETWLKGRAVGGSSSINGMVYVRGAPADYDGWEAAGCEGWGWHAMGRHFVALEDHVLGAKAWRGVGGPLKVSVHPSGDPLCEAFLTAAEQAGTPRVDDMNDMPAVTQGGMGYQPTSTYRGKRFSASRAFLKPARKRPNLDVAPQSDVLRILFEGQRASGVMLRSKDGVRRVEAQREVIVCAGAIESPKLLQLSGIGPRALLESRGIPVLVDAPQVGANLREHRYLSFTYKVRGNSLNQKLSGLALGASVLRYLFASKGPLTHAAHEVGGFVKTEPHLAAPDAQVGFGLYSFHTDDAGAVALDPYPGITVIAYYLRPDSQGEVRIASSDPDAPPLIDARHLTTETDRQRFVALFRWLRKLAAQPALQEWIVAETGKTVGLESDADILANAIELGGTSFHVCGTCRMGADDDAVVDPQLRVRGVTGLRVVDTSIMPTIVSGNTNAPAMAIALNAAEMILRSNREPA
jgi:choline dehydrogenase-like flavoprotein